VDYVLKFAGIEGQMLRLKTQFNDLKNEFDESVEYTKVFLDECKKQGIKLVSIGRTDEEIKSTNGWPFDPARSIFADNRSKDDWPAIWKVSENLGIGGGCGNSGQHQISSEAYARLVDGVYSYKNGKWSLKESTQVV